MKKAKLYIFDMDGTLLDSMPSWKYLGRSYLHREQITPPDNLEQITDSMTLPESAAYFQTLGLHKKTDDIIQGILSLIHNEYRLSIPAKPGMLTLIQHLSQNPDTTLCVLTTSERNCAVEALERLHMLSYFKDIHTSEELGLSKRTAAIYQTVCAKYHIPPADTIVVEDALYAIQAAKAAGCYVCAVPDSYSASDWDAICSVADEILQP